VFRERAGTLDAALASAVAPQRQRTSSSSRRPVASFDQFRDFEARGDAFRALVEALA
jgi:UDP-N-acetylmuramoylalanine--D-glutamate ligase